MSSPTLSQERGWRGVYSAGATDIPLSGEAAFLISATLGILYATTLFSPGFLLGTSDFWRAPVGIVGGGRFDMETTLSGYVYFVRDEWRFPLLSIPQLGMPEGTNAGLLDAVPLVALAGKAIFKVFGVYLNPYGVWSALMFVGSGLAMTFLLRAVGQRSLVAAIAGTAFGLLMPALHQRFGHLALSAQCLTAAALAAYFYRAGGAGWRGELAEWSIYVVALLTNPYLAAMCAAILLASIGKALGERRVSPVAAGLRVAMLFAGSAAILLILGMIDVHGMPRIEAGFGHYSMNLASPFWPQKSGLFAATGLSAVSPDVIGPAGQFEGYAYLGAGGLVLLLAGALVAGRELPGLARRHWPLLSALTLCAAFALSDKVYFGRWLILQVTLPQSLVDQLLAHFRGSGRFIWPAMYFLTFAGLAATLRHYAPRPAMALIGGAIVLQLLDVSLLHGQVAAAAAAHPAALADVELAALVDASDRVEIYPSDQCARETTLTARALRVGLQLLTAPMLKPINSVYAARRNRDCATERLPARLLPGTLYVFLDEAARTSRARYEAGACIARTAETICKLPALEAVP